MKRKWLAIGIILLFFGVSIAPSINVNVVKASTDDDLVEVTTQACGIKGYGNTTVKLTREQYLNLEQYLVDFRARLNQTSTREEAVPIFKEAVVELNKYGLLPRGMSVEQAQKLVVRGYQNQRLIKSFERLCNNNQYSINSNVLCLVAGESDLTFVVHRFNYWFIYGWLYLGLNFFDLYGNQLLCSLFLMVFGTGILLQILADKNPIALFDVFGIGYFYGLDEKVYYGSGWLKSFGLLGIKSWNGSLLGNLPGWKIPYELETIYVYPAMWGFCGIKIMLDEDGCQKSFIGTALALSVDNKP